MGCGVVHEIQDNCFEVGGFGDGLEHVLRVMGAMVGDFNGE